MLKILYKIGIDRIAHFGIGTLITMLCILAFSFQGIIFVIMPALVISAAFAFYKEESDKIKDKWDIIATLIGSLSMIGIYLFLLFTR